MPRGSGAGMMNATDRLLAGRIV